MILIFVGQRESKVSKWWFSSRSHKKLPFVSTELRTSTKTLLHSPNKLSQFFLIIPIIYYVSLLIVAHTELS